MAKDKRPTKEGEFDSIAQLQYDLREAIQQRDAFHEDALLMRRLKAAVRGIDAKVIVENFSGNTGVGIASRQEIVDVFRRVCLEANQGV